MFKISKKASNAFNNNQQFYLQNTCVFVDNKKTSLLLHGNKILWRDNNNNLYFCLCKWDTKTTCERLRACGLNINHKKRQLYYNDIAINDSSIYKINNDNTLTQL